MIVLTCAVLSGGCALRLPSGSNVQTQSLQPRQTTGGYQLTTAEQKLDCRRLTGRMQVRILQIRDRMKAQPDTVLATVRSALSTTSRFIMSGSAASNGYSAADRTKRDIEMLKAYNRTLANKNCATFDLNAELQERPVSHTPIPTLNLQ
ncbi:MAG: hypothetical protein AAGC70_00160 [Pseudomonadota bacterium]